MNLNQEVTKDGLVKNKNLHKAIIELIDQSYVPSHLDGNKAAIKDHCILMIKNLDETIRKIDEVEAELKRQKAEQKAKIAPKKKTSVKKTPKAKAAKKTKTVKKTKAATKKPLKTTKPKLRAV